MLEVKIAPSLLGANYRKMEEDIRACKKANASLLHIDNMDGYFVPKINFGQDFISSIQPLKEELGLTLDAHLMIFNPIKHIDSFADAGADWISVHVEKQSIPEGEPHSGHLESEPFYGVEYIKETLRRIRERNIRAGLAINPPTSFEQAKSYLSLLEKDDFILIMTVNPGLGGQKFIDMTEKIRAIRKNYKNDIEIDGGINDETTMRVLEAFKEGLEEDRKLILVSGSYVFKNGIAEPIRELEKGVKTYLLSTCLKKGEVVC